MPSISIPTIWFSRTSDLSATLRAITFPLSSSSEKCTPALQVGRDESHQADQRDRAAYNRLVEAVSRGRDAYQFVPITTWPQRWRTQPRLTTPAFGWMAQRYEEHRALPLSVW